MIVFLLSLVVAGTVAGDLIKAFGMRRQGAPAAFGSGALAKFASAVARNHLFWWSIVAYAISFFGFMALLSISDVSFAVPATAAGYAFETVLAKYLLAEQISAKRWAGALLVVVGVALVA
jgi:transporter family protein